MTKAGTIENNKRRLEEAHENLKTTSTESRAAFYQMKVRKAQDARRKNIKREKQALKNGDFSKKNLPLSYCAKCLIMSVKFCEFSILFNLSNTIFVKVQAATLRGFTSYCLSSCFTSDCFLIFALPCRCQKSDK